MYKRIMTSVVDMETADQIPGLAEPLFQGMGANIELDCSWLALIFYTFFGGIFLKTYRPWH